MLLTIPQTAEIVNKTRMTVFRWVRDGKLQSAKKRGRDWLIEAWEALEIREKQHAKKYAQQKNVEL